MEEQQRFADYFAICGLDESQGLDVHSTGNEGDNELDSCPLKRTYKSACLAHYPEQSTNQVFDPEAVRLMALPRGVSFCTQKNKHHSKFHSFVLTREDGSRSFGASLVIHERVTSQKTLFTMQLLQKMHVADETRAGRTRSRGRSDESDDADDIPHIRGRTTPRLKRKLHVSQSTFDPSRDALYVSKALVLMMSHPCVQASSNFLTGLWIAAKRFGEEGVLPVESYIYNLLFEVPYPPPGRMLSVIGPTRSAFLFRPAAGDLPQLDYSLERLLTLIGAEGLVILLTAALLEHQILCTSADYKRLMLVAEAVSALLFPFCWSHVYVPILPQSMLHFLDAPVPFIMGLHHDPGGDTDLHVPSETTLCVVDIDRGFVRPPDELPLFPHWDELQLELRELMRHFSLQGPHTDYRQIQLAGGGLDHGYGGGSHTRFGSLPRRVSQGNIGMPRRGVSPSLGSPQHGSPLHGSPQYHTASLPRSRRSASPLPRRGTAPDIQALPGNEPPGSPSRQQLLEQSSHYAKATALAHQLGVRVESIQSEISQLSINNHANRIQEEVECVSLEQYQRMLTVNKALRETFINRFLHMLLTYDQFVIPPEQNSMESWLSQRESVQSFDKAAFLSDQRETDLPFLCAFLETQMFTSFIDAKVLSTWEPIDPNLKLFDQRLRAMKEQYGEVGTPTYHKSSVIEMIEERSRSEEALFGSLLTSPAPHELAMLVPDRSPTPSEHPVFPALVSDILNREPLQIRTLDRRKSGLRRKSSETSTEALAENERHVTENRRSTLRSKPSLELYGSSLQHTNWKFVEALLKEAKHKIKRMVVEKMGREGVHLGHGELAVTGQEENSMLAALADLLERIWTHGLNNKKGKSALWSHLQAFKLAKLNGDYEDVPSEACLDGSPHLLDVHTRPAQKKGHRRMGSKGVEPPTLTPLRKSVFEEIGHIESMSDVRTDVGRARAWVRLALEKKALSSHLKELTAMTGLLKSLYKRYAFLRCEDEREQFLFHLLSLNAVDYHCFSSAFANTIVPYRILLFPSRKLGSYTSSANVFVELHGQMEISGRLPIPKNTLEMLVHHKNLGILCTMRVGHDNAGLSAKWMLENVLVRNELTGHLYRFPCGRWLAKGVDDNALERLLVADPIDDNIPLDELVSSCSLHPLTSPRHGSDSNSPRHETKESELANIQERLGDAVNGIVKALESGEIRLMPRLLAGPTGLAACLESALQLGLRSQRLLPRSKPYTWDFFEKVYSWMNRVDEEDLALAPPELQVAHRALQRLIPTIAEHGKPLGKEEKFQMLVFVGLRDQQWPLWLHALSLTPVAPSAYEDGSFLRDSGLLAFLVHILATLQSYDLPIGTALLRGLNV